MAPPSYVARLDRCGLTITSAEVSAFRDRYLHQGDLSSRMSELIWLDMYVLETVFGIDTYAIVDTIKTLDGDGRPSLTKPASQFRNPPLKGLWHKHYFSARFMAANMMLGVGGEKGVAAVVNEVMDPRKSPTVTQEMIDEIADRVTVRALEARSAERKLTGEWIIYLRHKGQNYYLCCETHLADDQAIYDRIVAHCSHDFPDLVAWIAAQQTTS